MLMLFRPPLWRCRYNMYSTQLWFILSFRRGMSTQFAISSLNDVIHFSKANGLPTFLCCLDSEKCFDKLCHMGMCWKLHDVLPMAVCRFLFQLYANRWLDSYGKTFKVRKGTRQENRLSQGIFNVFLNNLLESRMEGVHMEHLGINNIAFAEDITLVANTARGATRLFHP